MRILVFDNYDSFTYNLVHLVEKINHSKIDVALNDQIALEDIDKYDKIIISPGPGLPRDAGIMLPLINEYAASKSILGVCLGHQGIGEAFGGSLINLDHVYHGIDMPLKYVDENDRLLQGLRSGDMVGRYHSWTLDPKNFPSCITVTATDEFNNIMALRHNTFDVSGVQFHPESVLTPKGEKLLRNWLKK